MLTCLWELAAPPSGSELCASVVGGSASALDVGAPEPTWARQNREHEWDLVEVSHSAVNENKQEELQKQI